MSTLTAARAPSAPSRPAAVLAALALRTVAAGSADAASYLTLGRDGHLVGLEYWRASQMLPSDLLRMLRE
jgi:hypothetical protein